MNYAARSKYRALIVLLLVLTSIFMLVGCRGEKTKNFYSSDEDYGSRQAGDAKGLNGARMYGPLAVGIPHHNNEMLRVDDKIAYALDEMHGINMAYAMITDKNAYVAIILDNTATGTRRGGDRSVNNIGETLGTYDAKNRKPYAGKPSDVATGRNHYYTEKHNAHLSYELKQAIALKVRKMNPYVREVYISANRSFINEVNRYAIRAWSGKSLNDPSTIQQFNRFVSEQFPEHKVD